MASSPNKRLRILILWGPSFSGAYLSDFFLDNPKYDFEVVSGDRSKEKSPRAASWGKLWDLRRRLERGEFDLVISGPIQNSAWPLNKQWATRLAQAFRYFTYKHKMLDTYWASWLVGGSRKVPLAAIDFLDTEYVQAKDFRLLKAATLYFKLNLHYWPRRSLMPLEMALGMRRVTPLTTKLRPFTHGVPTRQIPATVRPIRERDIDVCFTGRMRPFRSEGDVDPFADLTYNPIRQDIQDRCKKLKGKFNVFCADDFVPAEEYETLLQRSKLIVCTESFGCETFRHYNVTANGAIPLINWPYSMNYRQLEPDVHAIYFSLIGDDFERTVARALADPAKLEEIAANARAFTLENKQRGQVGEMVIEETLREFARQQGKG